MVLPELVLQVIQIAYLIALVELTYLWPQVLHLKQVIPPESAGDHAAADLFWIDYFWIQVRG